MSIEVRKWLHSNLGGNILRQKLKLHNVLLAAQFLSLNPQNREGPTGKVGEYKRHPPPVVKVVVENPSRVGKVENQQKNIKIRLNTYPKISPDLARNTRGLHSWTIKQSRQNLVVFVFVLVLVLLGFSFATTSSFCSSVGRHPVFENRRMVSCCVFNLGSRRVFSKFPFSHCLRIVGEFLLA